MSDEHHHAHHTTIDLGPAFRWAVGLNATYVIVEFAAGLLTDSLALLADAAHNLTDVAGLLIAWGAAVLAKRAASTHYTFGYGRATIVAAMLNAAAILVGVLAVIWEAAHRLDAVVSIPASTVLVIALLGIAVNVGSAWMFSHATSSDLNAKGAFLHLATDAVVSGAVVVAALAMIVTGASWIDPAIAIAVSLVVAVSAYQLFRSSLRLSLDGVPESVNPLAVTAWLGDQPGVSEVHDLHIWALSTTRTAMAVHLVWSGDDPDAFLDRTTDALQDAFGIGHATIQIERSPCDRSAICRTA